MSGMCDTCEKSYIESGIPKCDDIRCSAGSGYVSKAGGIPISWIQEQIKKNPGRHASSWQYLLDIWYKQLLHGNNNGEKATDEYVRLHKNPTAAQKFWRNE